jgi:large subunit ribosomal protein L5
MLTIVERYKKEVIPEMKKIFGYKNDLAVPQLVKAVINVGVGRALKDDKFLDHVTNTLIRITGQKPVMTKAKKSISAFKIRAGMVVGLKVNLRGRRMYDFVDKLINVALPRVRDFRGLEARSIDNRGNLTIGFPEHLVFPEIKSDEVEKLHGLEVVIDTNAKSQQEGLTLFKLLGFPIKS